MMQPSTNAQDIAVSVIVPIYNAKDYIGECLDSLLRQTLQNIEIIAVDDGSTDGSDAIVDDYAARFPNKVLGYHKANGGAASARNDGLLNAKGEYLSFVDCDDWVDDDMLEVMVTKAVEGGADVAACDFLQFWPDHSQKIVAGAIACDELDDMKRIVLAMPGVANKIIRRSAFIDGGLRFPENSYYEDLAIHLSIPSVCKNALYLQRPYYHYRQHAQSKTSSYRLERSLEVMPSIRYALEIYQQRARGCGWPELEFKAIRHGFLTPSIRAIRAGGGRGAKQIVEQLRGFLDGNFPGWRKNQYIKPLLSKSQKALLFLLDTGVYRFTGSFLRLGSN